MHHIIQNVHKTQEYFLWALSQEIFEVNGITAFAANITAPNLNFAVQTGEIKDDIHLCIDAIDTFFGQFHLPWSWIVDPIKDKTALKEELEKRGCSLFSNYPVMIYRFDSAFPESDFKGVVIREVSSDQLSEWICPLQEAFQVTEREALFYQEAHQRALEKKANFRHFVAYIEGEPVSAATLSLSSYGARLDDIGTKIAFQRKGLATAVTLYAMKVAKELGYPWVCLEASDEGIPLYTKMGFTELYRNEVYQKKIGIGKESHDHFS